MLTELHPINKLKEYQDHLSQLLLNIRSHGELYKNGVDYLYNVIDNDLFNLDVRIEESKKKILKGILDDLNDSRRVWHYKVNSDEFKFVVTLIRDVEIKILQEAQEKAQNRIETLKLKVKPFAFFRGPQAYQNYKDYQKDKEELKSERHKLKVEEWKVKLDQKFEESRSKPLDKVAKESGSKYIKKETKKHDYHNNYCYYKKSEDGTYKSLEFRTLEEILDKTNPTYEDKQILLKWDIYQVKTLLKDKTLTEGDKKALKEILEGLEKEKDKSKKDFNPKNDGYIQKSKGARGVPQSTFQKALVQQGQRDMATLLGL